MVTTTTAVVVEMMMTTRQTVDKESSYSLPNTMAYNALVILGRQPNPWQMRSILHLYLILTTATVDVYNIYYDSSKLHTSLLLCRRENTIPKMQPS